MASNKFCSISLVLISFLIVCSSAYYRNFDHQKEKVCKFPLTSHHVPPFASISSNSDCKFPSPHTAPSINTAQYNSLLLLIRLRRDAN